MVPTKPGIHLMRRFAFAAATLLAVTAAQPALAAGECETIGDISAGVLPLNTVEDSARLSVNLGLWMKVINRQGFEASLGEIGRLCARGDFQAASTHYVLRGENQGHTATRIAAPRLRGRPTAYLLPVPDIALALRQEDPGRPAPIVGYALMSRQGEAHTVWRLYDGIPTDRVLLADMEEALSGQLRPAMHWRDGKVEILLPRKAQPAGAAS